MQHSPTLVDELRKWARSPDWAAFGMGPVLDAANHIEALQARIIDLERKVHIRELSLCERITIRNATE